MAKDEKTPMGERYLEDFLVGQTFVSGRARITTEEIQAFAAKFDPVLSENSIRPRFAP